MKKKLIVLAMFLALVLVLTGCACEHEWVEATCLTPKTCSKCEEMEGEALGHTWVDADCVTPKTCSACGETEGEALGHTFVDADCVTPKTCSVCAATEGEALGHTFVDADCVTPKTCSVCAATEGEALGHTWVEATCEAPKTCSVCAATEGEALGHTWVEATCEAPKTCSVCAATEGEALGHTWVEATCEAPKTCTVCQATEGEALGHSWEEADLNKVCTVCGAKEVIQLNPVTMDNGFTFGVPEGWHTADLGSEDFHATYVDPENKYFIIVSLQESTGISNAEMAEKMAAATDKYTNVNLITNPNGYEVINNENAQKTIAGIITHQKGTMHIVMVGFMGTGNTDVDNFPCLLRDAIADTLTFQ